MYPPYTGSKLIHRINSAHQIKTLRLLITQSREPRVSGSWVALSLGRTRPALSCGPKLGELVFLDWRSYRNILELDLQARYRVQIDLSAVPL